MNADDQRPTVENGFQRVHSGTGALATREDSQRPDRMGSRSFGYPVSHDR